MTIKKVLSYSPQVGNVCEIISKTLKLNLKSKKSFIMLVRRLNIRYNGTRHNEHFSHTQHKDIQNNVMLCDALFIMLSVIIL
jgi:hypothetical protein